MSFPASQLSLDRIRVLAGCLHRCGCTRGSFIHGCGHYVRRLTVRLNETLLPAKPVLCSVCAQELGVQVDLGAGALAGKFCDGCHSWEAFTVLEARA